MVTKRPMFAVTRRALAKENQTLREYVERLERRIAPSVTIQGLRADQHVEIVQWRPDVPEVVIRLVSND